MKIKQFIIPIIVGLFIIGGLVGANYYTATWQGGTGQNSENWTGYAYITGGTWGTTTAVTTETDPKWTASSTSYLTTANAASTYFTITNANASNTAWASDIYWTGTATNLVAATGRTSLGLGTMAVANTIDYLATGTAATTYLTITSAATNYVSTTTGLTYFTISGANASNTSWLADTLWSGVSTGLNAVTGRTSLELGDSAVLASSTWIKVGELVGVTNSGSPYLTTLGVGAGATTTAVGNTFIGYQSGNKNTTGDTNSAMGFQALYKNTTGYNNTASGWGALYSNTTSSANSAFGYQALFNNTIGQYNTAVGLLSLYGNTTGQINVAVGVGALMSNTNGSYNVAIGADALYSNTIGHRNTAIGSYSLGGNNLATTTTFLENTAGGYMSLFKNVSGNSNTAFGYRAGYNALGTGNVMIGAYAGQYETEANAFYVDNQNRTNTAGDKAGALLYGTFNVTPTNQTLKVNGTLSLLNPLTYANGGTGTSTALALQNLWWGDGTGKLVQVASSTLAGAVAGVSSLNTLTGALTIWGTTNQLTVTASSTVGLILSLPQNIHTGASPTFAGLTLSGLKNGFLKVDSSGIISTSTIDISADTNLAAGRSLTMSGDSVEADTELFTKSFSISIKNSTTTSNPAAQLSKPTAITITKVKCWSSSGTTTIQLDKRAEATPGTSGTDLLSASLACGTSLASTTAFASASVAADLWISLDIDSVVGGSTSTNISVSYQIDD